MVKRLFFLLVLCMGVVKLSAQIQGVVTDSETGEPIPYLNVYYEGKGVGVITDIDGNYSIGAHAGWNELTFSMVGYTTQVLRVSPKTRRLDVKMKADLMLDEVFAAHPGRTLNVGIIYDPEIAPESVYRSGFRAAAQRNGAPESVCVPFPAHRRDSLVHKLVERYAEGGAMMPLDAVIVDDPRVAPDSVKTELADIVSVMNESSLTYGRMLSRDFRLVHGFDAVAGYCYDLLRRHNMFTHNIAFPEVLLYRPVVNPDSAGGDIILIPDLYVQN